MKTEHKVKHAPLMVVIVSLGTIAAYFPTAAFADSVNQAFTSVADLLVAGQHPDGMWLGEENYTGSIVAGLVRAYEVTGNPDYLAAAELGVSYILDAAGGNYFGDEAYALARLAEATGEPAYADVAREFYNALDTAAYIAGFDATDRSNAVFYIAHHAVAAHKVGATDAALWRAAVMEYLSRIDDDLAYYPVMSLGVATWALAQTGPMDATKLDSDGDGADYWVDIALSDLPGILVTCMASSGGPEGSFCHRFDHAAAGPGFEPSGYTEDTVFGLLGLIAADAAGWDLDQEIEKATNALAAAVSPSGFVWEHTVLRTGRATVHWTYGGELLETMQPEPDGEAVTLEDTGESLGN